MKRIFVLFLFLLTGCAAAAPADVSAPTLPPAPTYFVVLDFGHGGFDAGAVGVDTGVLETELNLAIGEQVAEALIARGCMVLRTRTSADAIDDTKRLDMRRRGVLLNTEGADCTVSIHMNKFSDRTVSGPMCYYQAGAVEGQILAQCVMDALTDALERPSRLANPGNNYVTRIPAAPAVLVECGFLSNAQDEQLLQDAAYQAKLANAIAEGVLSYLQGDATPAPSVSPAPPV